MGKFDSLQDLELPVISLRKESRRVFSRAIPRHNGGPIKPGHKKGAGRMALMMFEKMETKIAGTKSLANATRVGEHPQITLADTDHSTIYPCLKHVRRVGCRFDRLH